MPCYDIGIDDVEPLAGVWVPLEAPGDTADRFLCVEAVAEAMADLYGAHPEDAVAVAQLLIFGEPKGRV